MDLLKVRSLTGAVALLLGVGSMKTWAQVRDWDASLSPQSTASHTPQVLSLPTSAMNDRPPTFNDDGVSPIFRLGLPDNPTRRRAFFLPQVATFILPGFDQWIEGQVGPGLFYSGVALGGIGVMQSVLNRHREAELSSSLDTRDNPSRAFLLGAQIYQAAGGLSAYASFRSAVRSQQANDRFMFLQHEETVGDLLAAPFAFDEALKPTTFIPLIAVAALVASTSDIRLKGNAFNGSDGLYGLAFSYNAGTHEEAVFRGWLMPMAMHYFDNRFWSNTATALLFAAAHLGPDNHFPWVQFVFGWYNGYLTQRNDWTLRQSVFLHAWWDIIAFTAGYLERGSRAGSTIRLAPITIAF